MLHKLKYILHKNRCCCETEVNKQQLKRMIQQGAVLLDVRSPQEFAEGHLENAVLLPDYEIKEKFASILPDKSQLIIVYCSTGHRSKKAQKTLYGLGYKKVYNLCKGLEGEQ